MYTKGKWETRFFGAENVIDHYHIITSEPARIIATTEPPASKLGLICSKKERRANARLIAAAPELLETLKLTLKTYSDMTSDEFKSGMDRQIREKMAAVITAAESEG